MKVICINDDWDKGVVRNPENAPKMTEVVTVLNEYHSLDGVPCYILEEYPFLLWEQENFAPLSDIDEMELVNEKLETA